MSTTSVAAEVRQRVLPSIDCFWRPEDFDASPLGVSKALSRLVASGDLRRVRRGLYWRGSATPLGMAPPPSPRIADEIVSGVGNGPTSWSAALLLGLSTQVPRIETIAVPRRAPRHAGPVRFVSRAASTGRRDERLGGAEVALLEVLRDWDRLVEVTPRDAVHRIRSLVDSGVVRVEAVARAAATEPSGVREELRSLFRALDRPADADRIRPARIASERDRFAVAA